MPKWAQAIAGSVMGVLFALNAWFASRAVARFDEMERAFWTLSQKVVVLEARFDALPKYCRFPQKGEN